MNTLARQAVARFLASLTNEEFDALVAEARGSSDGEPAPSDYHAVVRELQGQPDPRQAAVDALRRNVGRS